MQLESGRRLGVGVCIRQIYLLDGIRGFYRGLTASYAGKKNLSLLYIVMFLLVLFTGTCETAIHFVIYEHMKKLIRRRKQEASLLDCMAAAGAAKITASSMCYPHGE